MALRLAKKWKLIWILTFLMILSSAHAGQVTAASINLLSTRAPLSPTTYRGKTAWIHNDISTSEIIGIKRAGTLLEYNSQRAKRRILYRDANHMPFIPLQDNDWLWGNKIAVKQSLSTEIDSKYKIIRYIHDQDGEKDDLFHC